MDVKNLVKDKELKVLIVDDELDICYLLSGLLKQKQFDASYVTSLSDADIALRNNPPSILFLDNHLPDGFGLDFIASVREKYPAIKIVMITAHDSPAERKKAYGEGVDYFIPKPFSRNTIYSVIEKITDQST